MFLFCFHYYLHIFQFWVRWQFFSTNNRGIKNYKKKQVATPFLNRGNWNSGFGKWGVRWAEHRDTRILYFKKPKDCFYLIRYLSLKLIYSYRKFVLFENWQQNSSRITEIYNVRLRDIFRIVPFICLLFIFTKNIWETFKNHILQVPKPKWTMQY